MGQSTKSYQEEELVVTIDPWIIILLAFGVVCAIASGYIAKSKGYSYNLFALLGLLTGIVGLFVAAVLPGKQPNGVMNADALAKYKELLDGGVLTQEEFEKKKSDLLR